MISKTIVTVTPENIDQHPGLICFINPKHSSYPLKINWLKKRFKEGLIIKLLYLETEKQPVGFIEYVPGDKCWRSVDAAGYLFIHCLYTNRKKYRNMGLGQELLNEVESDARAMQLKGIAVITSDNAFMATREIFLKNGYTLVEESGKEQLLAKRFTDTSPPVIRDWQSKLKAIKGLQIIYTAQCPWVARFIVEAKEELEKRGIKATFRELTTPDQAQNAPSLYATFSLIYNGHLLADRYISITRFRNILNKEKMI